MPVLPPLTQTITIDAAQFVAGIDQMLARVEELAAALDQVEASTARLDGVTATASASETELSAAADSVAASVEAQNAAIDTLIGSLDTVVASVDGAAASVDGLTGSLDANAAAADRSAGANVTAAARGRAAFLGIAAGVAYAIVEGAKFQEQMTRLYTAAGLTGTSYKSLSQQVIAIGNATGFSGTKIAEALYHPISAGLKLGAALQTVANSARLAQIHGASLEDTTYALSSIMKAYGINAANVGKTSGLLNSIVGQGDMRFQDFVQSVKNWAPAGASMGISIQSMGAALAYLTDRGNSAEVASTRLTQGLSMITSPSKEASTYLSALGLTTGKLAIQNKTLQQVMLSAGLTTNKVAADLKKPDGIYVALKDVQGAFRKSGLSAQQADAVMAKIFGGGRSDKAMLSLLSNLGNLQSKYHSIGRAAGEYGSAWAKTQKTVSFEWHKVLAEVQNFAISLGSILLPYVQKALSAISKFFGFVAQHPALKIALAAVLALAVGLGVLTGATAAFGAVFDAVTSPVTLVVLAIAALVIGLYELYKHCALVRQIVADVVAFFKTAWQAAMHVAGAVIQWFVSGPLAWIKAQIAIFSKWWNAHYQEIKDVAKVVWTIIKNIVVTDWNILWGFLKAGLTILKAVWTVAWNLIVDLVRTVWDTIKSLVTTAIHVVLDVIGVVLDVLTGHWSQAWHDLVQLVKDAWDGMVNTTKALLGGLAKTVFDLGKNVIMGLINGIKAMAGGVINEVKSIASGVVNTFKGIFGIHSPSKVLEEIGLQLNAGLLKGLAESASKVKTFCDALASDIKRAFSAGIIGQDEAHSLTHWVSVENHRLAGLADERQKIFKRIAAARKFAQSTTQSLDQYAGVTNVVSNLQNANAPVTGRSILQGLQADLAKIKQFGDAIAKLRKLGLDKSMLAQIIAAGPDQGLQIAQALLDGPASELKKINQTEARIHQVSHNIGRSAADAMYDSGKYAGKGFLTGLEHQEKAIKALMERIAEGMIRTLRKRLGISSPSAVAHWHGLMFAQGLAKGIDDGRAIVEGATGRLGDSMRLRGGGLGHHRGGGDMHVHIEVHVPGGYIGSNQELTVALAKAVQPALLQLQRRNPLSQTSRQAV